MKSLIMLDDGVAYFAVNWHVFCNISIPISNLQLHNYL